MCKYCFECFCNDHDVIQFEKFVQSNIYMYQYLDLSSSWGLQVSKKHILTESYENLTNFAGQRMNDIYMYNIFGHAFRIPQARNVCFRTCLERLLGGLIIDRFDCNNQQRKASDLNQYITCGCVQNADLWISFPVSFYLLIFCRSLQVIRIYRLINVS